MRSQGKHSNDRVNNIQIPKNFLRCFERCKTCTMHVQLSFFFLGTLLFLPVSEEIRPADQMVGCYSGLVGSELF